MPMTTYSTYNSNLTGALVTLLGLFDATCGGLQSGKAQLHSGCAIGCV